MRVLYFALLVCLGNASSTLLSVANAEEPSAVELIGLATTVNSAGRKHHRTYVAGETKMGGFFDLDFFAQYRAPNQYSMCIKKK